MNENVALCDAHTLLLKKLKKKSQKKKVSTAWVKGEGICRGEGWGSKVRPSTQQSSLKGQISTESILCVADTSLWPNRYSKAWPTGILHLKGQTGKTGPRAGGDSFKLNGFCTVGINYLCDCAAPEQCDGRQSQKRQSNLNKRSGGRPTTRHSGARRLFVHQTPDCLSLEEDGEAERELRTSQPSAPQRAIWCNVKIPPHLIRCCRTKHKITSSG